MALIAVGGTLHNTEVGNVTAYANEILDQDKGKKQSVVNQETDNALEALDGRADALESAVGTGGSVDTRIAAAKAEIIGNAASDYNTLGKVEDKIQAEVARATAAENDRYTKSETYTKTELNNLITTPNQGYVTVVATDQTSDVTDVLPASGSADTIYRVCNWDGSAASGSEYDVTCYSEYAWDGTEYQFLCVKSQIGEVFDISAYNSNTEYVDLAAALGNDGANVPASIRRGGMSVKFVCSSDHKYVQWRYMSSSTANADFTNVANWQGVDNEPMPESQNLVKSGGVNDIVSNYFVKENLTLINNSIIDNTRTIQTGSSFSNYKITEPISVQAGSIIFIATSSNFNNCFYVFYDDNNNVIDYRLSEIGGTVQRYKGFVKVPSGATKIRLCQINNALKATLCRINSNKIFYDHFDEISNQIVETYNNIINHLDLDFSADKTQITSVFQKATGNEVINVIEPASNNEAGAMTAFDKQSITDYINIPVTLINNTIILDTTGYPETSSAFGGYKISSPLDVSSFEFVYISASANYHNYLYAFYDTNDEFISGKRVAVTGSTPEIISKKLILVPNNAKYLRVAQVNSSTQVAIYFQKNIIDSISEIKDLINPEVKVPVSFSIISDRLIDTNGTITEFYGGYDISDYIPVNFGEKYLVSASANFKNYLYAFYNSENTLIGGRKTSNTDRTAEVLTDEPIEIPDNVSYLVVCWVRSANVGKVVSLIRKSTGELIEELDEKIDEQVGNINERILLSEKKWLAIGDSLTAKDTLGSNVDNYVDYTARILDLTKIFNAIGGTGYWRPGAGSNNNFYHRVLNYSGSTPDIITVFGSFNDLGGGGSVLGTVDDNTEDTVCGCMNLTLDALISQFPAASIGVITPTQWSGYYNNSRAIDYVSALKQICEKKGLPVLDLFHTSNLHPNIASFRTTYYLNADGVHPNTEGHKRFAKQVADFIKKISFV